MPSATQFLTPGQEITLDADNRVIYDGLQDSLLATGFPYDRTRDNENNFADVQAWFCSEMTSAMLMNCCPAFYDHNVYDPALISPCRLEGMLKRMEGVKKLQSVPLRAK